MAIRRGRRQIGLDARARGHLVTQRDDARHFALDLLHRLREGVAQALDQLEQRQVHITELTAEHVRPAALLQHGLEIAEIFRRAVLEEIFGEAFGLRLGILVIELAAERMVRIVDFLDEIGHRELQLVQPEPVRLQAWRKLQARAEIEQNLGGLCDHQLAGLEERRREGRALLAAAVHHRHHFIHAGFRPRNVVVSGAGILQRQTHEFASALDLRPIKQLVAHGITSLPFRGASFARVAP